ncbi:MAG: hypothetical protein ACEPOZ_19095 [Marinifilaceae bacterium]
MKFDYSKEDMLLKVYPTFTGCVVEGWDLMKKYFLILFLAVLVVGLADIPLGIVNIEEKFTGVWLLALAYLQLIGFVYWLAFMGPLEYSLDWIFLKASRGTEPKFDELLTGFRLFGKVILARLLSTVLIVFGFIFFIIPGLFLLCKLVFVSYLVVDKKVDAVSAIKLSWHMSNGYFLTILGMGIFFFVVIVIGFFLLIIGAVVAVTWAHASFAMLYKAAEELHYKDACTKIGIPLQEEVS